MKYRLTVPLFLAASTTGVVEPGSFHVAFAHDYEQPGDPGKLHRVISDQVRFAADGSVAGFSDSRGRLEWSAAAYDSGQASFLHWGRWTRGIIGGSGLHSGHDISGAEGVRNSFRYIAGPVSKSPLADAATFSLLGGHTGPTAGEGGGTSITLLTRGEVNVNADGSAARVTLALRVASGIYSFESPELPLKDAGFSTTESIPTSGVLCIPGCSTHLEGFITGEGGTEVGLAFSIDNPALSKQINGVAAFKRD